MRWLIRRKERLEDRCGFGFKGIGRRTTTWRGFWRMVHRRIGRHRGRVGMRGMIHPFAGLLSAHNPRVRQDLTEQFCTLERALNTRENTGLFCVRQ